MVDDNGGDKVKFDHNVVLSKKAAFRVVGAWEDTVGQYRFEYKKNFNITPSVTLIPFESGKVKINFDFEYLKERFNYNDYGWIYSDFAGWKDAAKNGTYGTSTAVLSNTIAASVGNNSLAAFSAYPVITAAGGNGTFISAATGYNVIQNTTTPTVGYTTYTNNKRTVTGNLTMPSITNVVRGGYYTDKSGNFVYDEHFNYTSRGSYSDNEVKVATTSLEFSPFEWLSGRAAWVRDVSNFNNYGNSALTTPYADGPRSAGGPIRQGFG